jgi:hypothetical protein
MMTNPSDAQRPRWEPWEHDRHEPDLYVRHGTTTNGERVTDYLGLSYLNALEADLGRAREENATLKSSIRSLAHACGVKDAYGDPAPTTADLLVGIAEANERLTAERNDLDRKAAKWLSEKLDALEALRVAEGKAALADEVLGVPLEVHESSSREGRDERDVELSTSC